MIKARNAYLYQNDFFLKKKKKLNNVLMMKILKLIVDQLAAKGEQKKKRLFVPYKSIPNHPHTKLESTITAYLKTPSQFR